MEEAVRAHVFHRTVQDIQARNADTGPDELQTLIDDTVREVRAGRCAKAKN
jgi:Ribbon-helix-helix domain